MFGFVKLGWRVLKILFGDRIVLEYLKKNVT